MTALRELGWPVRIRSGGLLSALFHVTSKTGLDFERTASVCGVMDEFERDEISKGFADLMAALENAAAQAIEGQLKERSLAFLQDDVNRLWPMMTGCIGILASLDVK